MPQTGSWGATAQHAMEEWGLEEGNVKVVVDQVIRVVVQFFGSELISVEGVENRAGLRDIKISVMTNNYNFFAPLYWRLNDNRSPQAYGDFTMSNKAALFFHTFKVSLSKKGGLGVLLLERRLIKSDDRFLELCGSFAPKVEPSGFRGSLPVYEKDPIERSGTPRLGRARTKTAEELQKYEAALEKARQNCREAMTKTIISESDV